MFKSYLKLIIMLVDIFDNCSKIHNLY